MYRLDDLSARALSVGLRIVRPSRHFYVHGMPSTEGNIVEIARAVANMTDDFIVWPGAPSVDYREAVGIPPDRVKRLRTTRSAQAVWAFLRARAVFHTHGVYGN